MPVFVRAVDPVSGAEITVSAELAQAAGLTVLDGRDALDEYGRPLPAKPRIDKGAARSVPADQKEN